MSVPLSAQTLSDLSKSVQIVPTSVEFVDIAGLVKGASKGEGLGNQFLANIRECDAIAQVVARHTSLLPNFSSATATNFSSATARLLLLDTSAPLSHLWLYRSICFRAG